MPMASPRRSSGMLKRIQRMPAGFTTASPTPEQQPER